MCVYGIQCFFFVLESKLSKRITPRGKVEIIMKHFETSSASKANSGLSNNFSQARCSCVRDVHSWGDSCCNSVAEAVQGWVDAQVCAPHSLLLQRDALFHLWLGKSRGETCLFSSSLCNVERGEFSGIPNGLTKDVLLS